MYNYEEKRWKFMNRILCLGSLIVYILCMTGCGKVEAQEENIESETAETELAELQTPAATEAIETSSDSVGDKQFFYEKLIKESGSPGSELYVHEVQDLADGKLVYTEWTGERTSFEILFAVKDASGEWKIKEIARHMPAGPLGSPGMVLAAGFCREKMVLSIVMEEVHTNPDTDVSEVWNPDHIQLFFADGSSQNVEIHQKERKMLVLDGKKQIVDWKVYTEKEEEVYSYTLAEKGNYTPMENLDFIEIKATPAPDNNRQFFCKEKMKDNTNTDCDLRVHEVQEFADGKLIYAEWVGEGASFDISYAVKQASGEWEMKEASGHAPAGSPGMALGAGMCQGKMIVSIVVEDEHWNPDTDMREIWNPDHIQLFFADGSSQNVEIQAKGRKMLVLDEKKKVKDWKLFTEKGEEIYSYALAKKWNYEPVEKLDFIKTE